MISRLVWAGLVLGCGVVFGQTPARFEIADVHVTPKALANAFMEANPPRNGRFEFHSASMIDLIQLAYGFDDDKILGGPSWLEMDRFEVIAQAPAGTNVAAPPGSQQGTLSDAVRTMMQSLLADRFKLVVRPETKLLPGFALTVDKKVQMKQGDGTGDTGCKYVPPTEPTDTTMRFACRNMSMDAFPVFLWRLGGALSVAILDKTELKGVWNFELKMPRNPSAQDSGNEIGIQLALKLEPGRDPHAYFASPVSA